MTPKALTTALIVQFASITSFTSISYGLMFSDANRFIQLDRDAVARVVQPIRGGADTALTHIRSAIGLCLKSGSRSK
jgi:hypothetical protein